MFAIGASAEVTVCVQFAAQEEKRQKNERLQQTHKHDNQSRDLQMQCDGNARELQQLQVSAAEPQGAHTQLVNNKKNINDKN